MNDNLKDLLKKIPLEERIKSSNENMLLEFIVHMGFRKNKSWTSSDSELLNRIMEFAKIHSENQIKDIYDWINDGMPLL